MVLMKTKQRKKTNIHIVNGEHRNYRRTHIKYQQKKKKNEMKQNIDQILSYTQSLSIFYLFFHFYVMPNVFWVDNKI